MTTSSTIQGYYSTILNRPGSATEVAAWASLVANGSLTLAGVQSDIANSAEALTFVAPIVEMYQADLGRVPDQTGLLAWVSALESGTSYAAINAAIAGSAESQAFYGVTNGIPTVASVSKMYLTILGRAAAPGDAAGWANSGLSEATIQQDIAGSAEANARAIPAVTAFLTSVANGGAYLGSLYPTPTYTLAPGAGTVNDGGTVSVALTTTNVAAGTVLAYTVTGLTGPDALAGSVHGSFTVDTTGHASVPLTLLADTAAGPDQTMTITLDALPTITAAVTVHDTSGTTVGSNFTLTPGAASVNAGGSDLITLAATGATPGATYQYSIGGASSAADVGGSLIGTFTVDSSGLAIVQLNVAAGAPTENLTVGLVNGLATPATIAVKSTTTSTGGTFTLTPGQDTATANQFNASETFFNTDGHGPTLNPGDNLTGKAGATNNTLSITDLTAGGASDNLPAGLTLSNIQNVVLNSSGNTAPSGFNTSGVAGVNTLAVTTAGNGADVVQATNGVAGNGTAVTVTHNSTVGGTVTVLGGNQVTATQNAAGSVLVGLTGGSTVPLASNVATSSINVTTNSTGGGDVDVVGGTNVSIIATGPSYTGTINIGNDGVNTGNNLAGGLANPSGNVVVNDAGVGSSATVFGGTTVTVNAAGSNGTAIGNVIVGDAIARIASNQRSGVGAVTDTSPVAFDGLSLTTADNNASSNVSMYGGTDANVTTNAGAVTIGTATGLTGTLPSGNVTVVDTANDGLNINAANSAGVTVYGGVNVSATAADANVLVGGTTSIKALPSGTVAATETKATTQQDLVGGTAGVHTIGVDGGNGVTVTALGQNVTIGANFGTAGAQLVTQTGVLTGVGLGVNSGTVTVDGGTTVGITTTGGTVTVGAAIGSSFAVPTGAVTVTDTFGSGNATKDDISVLGGTTVNVAVRSADKGNITIGGLSAGVTLNAGGTALNNPTISPSGAVSIVDAQTNGATTTYGTGAVNVVTNGSPGVSIQGGKVGAIVDAQSTLATGGANSGKAVGASTLASVVLDGVQTGGAVALKSDALTSLTILDNNVLNNVFTVTNSTAGHALALTLGNDSQTLNKDGSTKSTNNFTVVDAIATALTIGDSATPSSITPQASTSTVSLSVVKAASLTMNNATAATLNLAGDTALTAITLTGAGNVTLLNAALAPANQAFAFNASKASGNVTTDFTTTATAGVAQTFLGGSGVDTVAIGTNASGWGSGVALQGGSGTTDVLVANYAAAGTDIALGNATAIKGFEILGLGALANSALGTYDASGFSGVTLGVVAGNISIVNASKGAFLSITAAPTGGTITFAGAATTGAADALTINVGVDAAGTVLGTTSVLAGTVTTNGYEAVTVNSLGKAVTAGAPSVNTMALTDTSTTGAGTLAITGDTSLTLTAASSGFTAITATDTGATVNVNAVGLSNIGSTITGGSAALLATGSAGGTEVASIVLGGTGATPFAVADTVVVTLKSADGATNVGTYTYTVPAGVAVSAATAAASLVAAINAGATTGATVLSGGNGNNTVGVTARASGGSIVLTGVANTPFQVQTSKTGANGTATQTLLGGVQQELITVAGTPVAGDTLIVTINNVAIPTVTLPASPTAATAAIALAAAITTANPAGIASAVAVGNTVLVTGSSGNAYTLTAAATGGSTVAAAETVNYATVAENYVSGAGGATFTLGVGGSWNTTAHKYSSGSETVNLAASLVKSDSIIARDGGVSTFNGVNGGISSFTVGSQAASDALTFATTGKTAATNVTTTTVGTLTGASAMAAVLDPAGALLTAMGNMTFSISNGVITFGAVGGHSIGEFTTAQLISAAEIIVNSSSNGGGANKVAAFSNGTDSFVVASDNAAILRSGVNSADILLQLRGLTSVSGFGSTFGAGVIVSTNVTNGLANAGAGNTGSSTATTTYDDSGFSRDTLTAAGQGGVAIGVTTYNNLAASAELDINSSNNIGSIVTSQVGASGANSLTVAGSTNSNTINSLTVAGDGLVVFNGVTNNLTYAVTKLVDSTNTMNTIKVISGGGSTTTDLAAITSTALTTIDLTGNGASTVTTKLGDGASLSQAGLTVKDTPLPGSPDTGGTVIIGSWSGPTGSLGLSGAGDVVTLGTSAANNNKANLVFASGAGDTITIDGTGANSITANGAGNTITVGDTANGVGANTIIATGAGDTVTFLGTQAGASTATVGSGANVTFGNAGVENVIITGDLTGATSSGTFAFVTLNNLVGNLGSGNTLKFNNFTGANTEVTAATTFGGSMVNVASAGTLGQALDLAVSQAATSQSPSPNTAAFAKIAAGVGVLDWFQFGGNTYIAEANNTGTAAATHTALGISDAVVKISGLADLSGSTLTGHTLTFAVGV